MSSLMGSVIRYLERMLNKIETGITRFKFSLPSLIEYLLVKMIYFGDKTLAKITYVVKRISRIINLLQISMIDSMIIVSLWYGFLTFILILLVTIIYVFR